MQPIPNKRWVTHAKISAVVDDALSVYPPLFRQVLFNRGVVDPTTARTYLDASLPSSHPFDLKGMPEAVERILWAIQKPEKIAVYGDYDVDGVTATALLVEVLNVLGANVSWHIPHRYEEGYGLNKEALSLLAGQGVDLVITVDCGIRSPAEADHAREQHIDLIISDHHHPAAELPVAAAIICPKQPGDLYPDKDLSGVGLAYKIAQALLERKPVAGVRAENWLDLVALGTVSDVVPLKGENRALVRRGLELLRQGRRQGIVSLAGAAGVKLPNLSTGDIGFMLGPRLNASGRLESALASLNLLMEPDSRLAGDMALKLDDQNRERQVQTRQMQEIAAGIAAQNAQGEILFAFSPEFKSGIVGLVASRLVDTYYRPAIVGQIEEETARASCRSIPEFHITHALDECKDLLVRHGGHSVAAGFTVRLEHLAELQQRLSELALEDLGGRDLFPILTADADINLSSLQQKDVADLISCLTGLQPTGQENPEATFISRDLRVVNARAVGGEKQHLKLTVNDGRVTWDAIAFRQAKWLEAMPPRIDLLYAFERNEFNGRTTLQLAVRDIRPTTPSAS